MGQQRNGKDTYRWIIFDENQLSALCVHFDLAGNLQGLRSAEAYTVCTRDECAFAGTYNFHGTRKTFTVPSRLVPFRIACIRFFLAGIVCCGHTFLEEEEEKKHITIAQSNLINNTKSTFYSLRQKKSNCEILLNILFFFIPVD